MQKQKKQMPKMIGVVALAVVGIVFLLTPDTLNGNQTFAGAIALLWAGSLSLTRKSFKLHNIQ